MHNVLNMDDYLEARKGRETCEEEEEEGRRTRVGEGRTDGRERRVRRARRDGRGGRFEHRLVFVDGGAGRLDPGVDVGPRIADLLAQRLQVDAVRRHAAVVVAAAAAAAAAAAVVVVVVVLAAVVVVLLLLLLLLLLLRRARRRRRRRRRRAGTGRRHRRVGDGVADDGGDVVDLRVHQILGHRRVFACVAKKNKQNGVAVQKLGSSSIEHTLRFEHTLLIECTFNSI